MEGLTKSEAAELVHYIASLRAAMICSKVNHPWPGPVVHDLLVRLNDYGKKKP